MPEPLALLRWYLPVDASAHGPALDQHLLLNLRIALGLLALAHLILLAGLISHRRTHRPIHKLLLEYLPLAALTLLFTFLAVRAQSLWASQRYTGADLAAMQVEATGMQFAWYFRYPGTGAYFGRTQAKLVAPQEGNPLGLDPTDPESGDDVVTSQLVLPVNREVDLIIRSLDVIHGFSVPELRLKQNAMPGQPIHIHFTPTKTGDFAILCTQVCGSGHYRMAATLRVLPTAVFDLWLRDRERATQVKP